MSIPLVPPEVLRRLGGNRWAMPVMAFLHREGGARFAVVARRFGISPHSLARCLEYLRECGWLIPNPGHGHPLRPEYLLSDAGRPVGVLSDRIMGERERQGLDAADLSRWSLPLVAGLVGDWRRFGELQVRLDPISPRALSLTLKQAIEQTLVDRRVEDAFPPVALYGLSGRGRDLAAAIRG
jgi:DNA-binding HxlR family transcriptional regulator